MIKHWTKVFKYTLKHNAGSPGYIRATLIVAIILLAAIPFVMVMADGGSSDDNVKETSITRVICANGEDLSALSYMDKGIYSKIKYETAPSLDDAAADCIGDATAIILAIDGSDICAIVPDNSDITISDAESYAEYAAAYFPYVAAINSGVDLKDLSTPAYAASALEAEDTSGMDTTQEVLNYVVPYVVMMLMYFMVLVYGQGVAENVIMEKTSKLMDLFLVSIKPAAMVLGKTLAVAASGMIQVIIWLGSIAGGCYLGVTIVKMLNPGTSMGLIMLFDSLGGLASIFTPHMILMVILVLVFGFLLYCSLSAIGGSLAGKPEDLSTTNYLFTLVLVISFFACLYAGTQSGMLSTSPILNYIPFTAILVVPGRLITGEIATAEAAASAGIIAISAILLMLAAGKVYTMMSFYRGKPMNPIKLIQSLRAK